MSRQLPGWRSEGSVIPPYNNFLELFSVDSSDFCFFPPPGLGERLWALVRADNRWNRQDLEKAKRQSEARSTEAEGRRL